MLFSIAIHRSPPKTRFDRQSLAACSVRSGFSVASGTSNSSYGNSSTATMNNEPSSLMSDDLMPEDFETGTYGNDLKTKT